VDVAIYVDQAQRKRGIGRALYAQLIPQLTQRGYMMAYAGITLPNAPSVALHESVGFRVIGTYRNVGFKLGQWLTLGWYELQLPATLPANPAEPFLTRI
jgi:phosphinothricin acetyltransferase